MTTKRIHNGLNQKEQKVLQQFVKVGRPSPKTLNELAEACFPKLAAPRANSWVRNSIRRLVALGAITHVEKGTYGLVPETGREVAKLLLNA